MTGQFTKILGTISDITQRKSDEKVNSASHEYYRALVHNSFDICMLLDKDLFICFIFNPMAMWRILGYEEEEVIGESFTVFIHDEDVSLFTDSIEKKLIEPNRHLRK